MKEESEVYKTWYVGRAATCKEVQEDIRKWSEWQRYLECQKLPDPDSQKSLNTFLSQWEEAVRQPCRHCLSAASTLTSLWREQKTTDVETLIDSMDVVGQVAKRMKVRVPNKSPSRELPVVWPTHNPNPE